jgi:hypothetical protein
VDNGVYDSLILDYVVCPFMKVHKYSRLRQNSGSFGFLSDESEEKIMYYKEIVL